MEIIGIKIGIRKFTSDDIHPFCEAVKESFKHMKIFMPWCHSEYSIEESESWVNSRDLSWANEQEFSFVIYSLTNKEILGGVGINEINSTHKIGNIGYWVRKKALNQGVATEAVNLIASFGFNSQKFNRLEIVMVPNNGASRKVAEKVGATYDGILKKRLLVYGESLDACLYSLVNDV